MNNDEKINRKVSGERLESLIKEEKAAHKDRKVRRAIRDRIERLDQRSMLNLEEEGAP